MAARVARVLPPQFALALLLVVSLATRASAQRVALAVTGPTSSAYSVVDLATGIATPATDDEAQVGAVFTSDGLYALRLLPGFRLTIRHMPSGQQSMVGSAFLPRFAHPRRHTLFGTDGNAPARFDERGGVRWDVCGILPSAAPAMDLSADGGTLYATCPNGDLVALDTESGVERPRLTAAATTGLALNAAATEAVVLRRTGSGLFDLIRLDLATGQTLATRPIYSVRGTAVVSTPDHTRLLLTVGLPVGAEVLSLTTLVDGVTLDDVVGLASSWRFDGHSVAVSPDGRQAFTVSRGLDGAPTAVWTDINSGATRATASVPAGYALALGYAPASLPPVVAPAQVASGTVTLSWTLPDASPMVTGYRVEAGTAPGLANIGVFPAGDVGVFAATGVPPGRYYVRVCAVNANGVSAPSNEVIVDVP